MATITVSTTTLSHAQITGLGGNKTGTASVTNASASVTLNTAIPSSYVGRGGYGISLGGTIYEVLSTESTTAITLNTVYAGSTNASAAYILYPAVELRLYVINSSFTPYGTTLRCQMGSPGSSAFYKRVLCTVRPISGINSLIIPTLTLYSTADIANTSERGARYSAWFHRLDGSRISAYAGFESFALDDSPTSTDWTQIAAYNRPAIHGISNNSSYNTEQINALLSANGGISATPNYLLKANTGTTGGDAAAYESGGNIVFTGSHTVAGAADIGGAATIGGQTDPAGGFKQRSAAQVAALTAGAYGRLTWQTDALKGFKKDYGANVGIRHAQPFYDAYEQGFIPSASDSTTRVLNTSLWNAFISALPATGGVLRFPEGIFYFSGELSTTKPVQVVGAGASFVSGGTMIGTTIVVESGENGFEFLSGASGSSVSYLNIKTRSGYSGVSTGDGIYSAVEVHIDNVSIESMGRDGIYFHGDTANTDFSSVTNVKVWGVKRDGIHYNGGADTNVIFTSNVNCTLNGRYGFYNAGSSNIFLGCHVSYSAQVTAGSKDYYDAGSSNVYILPYSENGTGSEYFYFDTGAVRSTVICGAFGAPIFDAAAPGFYGKHTILEDGRWRDLLIRGTGDDVSDHDYELISRNIDAAGGLILNDATASARVFSYAPATTTITFPSVSYSGVLKATGTPQTLTGAGAVNLTTDTTYLVTTGTDALTLGAGAAGQIKTITMITDGGDGTLSPTNPAGYTTITFTAVGQSVTLKYLNSKWVIVGYWGVTIS